MFSIVIPTKDEEKNIGTLLKSIREQTIQPKELVVSDKSIDRTAEIAKEYRAKVVEGVRNGRIGLGRNLGAKHVTTSTIIFFDGDNKLPRKDFLEKALAKFKQKNYDVATFYYKPNTRDIITNAIFVWINSVKILTHITKKPIIEGGAGIVIKRDLFEKLGGFREDVLIGEDIEFIREAEKAGGKFGLLPFRIQTSSRRYYKKSPTRYIQTLLGSIGLGIAILFGIKWFKKRRRKFERMYGATGGTPENHTPKD